MPFTLIIFFNLTYLGLYFGMVFMLYMFTLNWFWLFVGYPFLIGLISGLVIILPSGINYLIYKLYNLNWFSVITHIIAGILGVIYYYYYLKLNPPTFVNGNQSANILKVLWEYSWLKTILLFPIFIGIQLSVINIVFIPIKMKLEKIT